MAGKAIPISLILLICFAANASSQGYMGTVATGTGTVPALTVGKSSISTSELGALSGQPNLTGTWSLDLNGPFIRHIDLQAIQKGDFIMGTGLMDKGTTSVTAAGSVAAGGATLFVCQADGGMALRLYLTVSGTSLAGEYDLLSADGPYASGTVTGSMNPSVQLRHVTPLGGSSRTSAGTSANSGAGTGAFVGSAVQSIQEQE